MGSHCNAKILPSTAQFLWYSSAALELWSFAFWKQMAFMCITWFSQETQVNSLNSINQWSDLPAEVETEFLNIIHTNVMLQRVNEWNEMQSLPSGTFPLTVHLMVGSGSPSASQRTTTFWYKLAVCTVTVSTNLIGSDTTEKRWRKHSVRYKQV
jgi:hypothetical protein